MFRQLVGISRVGRWSLEHRVRTALGTVAVLVALLVAFDSASIARWTAWIVNQFAPPLSDAAAQKLISVRLFHHDGMALMRDFTMSYSIGDQPKIKRGTLGVATITVPTDAVSINVINVNLPCFTQLGRGPYWIPEDGVVHLPLEKRVIDLPPPLLPEDFPDPAMIPKPGDAHAAKVASISYAVQLSNQVDVPGRLLLFSHARHGAGERTPWREIYLDPCNVKTEINGFTEASGWFSLYFKPENGLPVYLDTIDLYASPETYLMLDPVRDGFHLGQAF